MVWNSAASVPVREWGAGHSAELLVHAEQVLEGDRRVGLRLLLDGDVLLGLDRLVQAVTPATPRHLAAGELVDDDDLALLDDVVDVLLVEGVGPQRLVDVVVPVEVLRASEVADVERHGCGSTRSTRIESTSSTMA